MTRIEEVKLILSSLHTDRFAMKNQAFPERSIRIISELATYEAELSSLKQAHYGEQKTDEKAWRKQVEMVGTPKPENPGPSTL